MAGFGRQVVERFHTLRVEDFIDTAHKIAPLIYFAEKCQVNNEGNSQWRIVTGTHGRISHDQGCTRVGVALLQVMVNFRGTLATSQNTNVVWVEIILQQGGQGRAVLGGMHDAWILGNAWGHLGLTPNSNNYLACLSCDDLARRKVTGKNSKVVHHRAVGVRLPGNDFCHFLSVGHHIRESLCTPPHIVFELQSGRKEGSQVGEVDQSTFLLEVIEEGEAAAGVTEGSQVFDERNLHPGAGDQHP